MLRPLHILLLASLFSLKCHAGPDWQAIENARGEKQQQKQEEVKEAVRQEVQQAHQLTAFEKLKLACGKVARDAELNAACAEIIAAYKELDAAGK